MDVSRLTAALALPCLCLGAQTAAAQSRPASGEPIQFELRRLVTVPADEEIRLRPAEPAAAPRTGMIQSWVDGNAEVGLGRFTVPNSARPRTHTERMGIGLDPETRRIAGAGMHIRFWN